MDSIYIDLYDATTDVSGKLIEFHKNLEEEVNPLNIGRISSISIGINEETFHNLMVHPDLSRNIKVNIVTKEIVLHGISLFVGHQEDHEGSTTTVGFVDSNMSLVYKKVLFFTDT